MTPLHLSTLALRRCDGIRRSYHVVIAENRKKGRRRVKRVRDITEKFAFATGKPTARIKHAAGQRTRPYNHRPQFSRRKPVDLMSLDGLPKRRNWCSQCHHMRDSFAQFASDRSCQNSSATVANERNRILPAIRATRDTS